MSGGNSPNEGGTTGPPSFMSFLDMSGGGFFYLKEEMDMKQLIVNGDELTPVAIFHRLTGERKVLLESRA